MSFHAATHVGDESEAHSGLKKGVDRRSIAFRLALIAAGLVLMTAAALKAWPLMFSAQAAPMLWMIAQVEVEWLLGLWLLSGVRLRLAWMAALLLFTVFAGVNAVKLMRGESECGCFGPLETSPWVTLLIDLAVIALLVFCRPPNVRQKRPNAASETRTRPLFLLAGFGVTAALAAAVLMSWNMPQPLVGRERISQTRTKLYVRPARWSGQVFPLLDYMDIGDRLAKGRWRVLLYHHDCSRCREAIQSWIRGDVGEDFYGRALVEVPPFGSLDAAAVAEARGWVHGRLSDDHTWFVPTPVFVQIQDGIVKQVRRELEWPVRRPRVGTEATSGSTTTTTPALEAEAIGKTEAIQVASQAYDFGYVKPGGVDEANVSVANPLAKPLEIESIESECVCLEVLDAPLRIPARGTVKLRLRFTAPQQPQHYAKQVVLFTANARVPVIELTVRARVGLPLTAEPKVVRLLPAGEGKSREAVVTITNDGEQSVRLLYSTSNQPGVFAMLPREPIPPGGEVNIPIKAAPLETNSRNGSAAIRIHTSSSHQPVLTVQVEFSEEGTLRQE